MNSRPAAPLPEPNPVTRAAHRRQVSLQIWLPLILVMLLILTACVLVIIGSTGQASDLGQWRDVSLVWILFPILFASLIFLITLAALIFLNTRLIKYLPRVAHLAQIYIDLFGARIYSIADKIVQPVIGANTLGASVGHIRDRLFRKHK